MRADAAHDLVVDQQDAVAVADLADARIVAVGRDQRVGRRAADRLHDEGDDALRPLGEDLLLQHVGISAGRARPSRGCRGRDRRSAPGSSASSRIWSAKVSVSMPSPVTAERAERAAMIGRHAATITSSGFGWPVATAHCRASLMQDSTASEPPETKKMRSRPPGMLRGELARQFLGRLVLEMQPVGEGGLVHLPLHRVEHVACCRGR